MVQSHIKAELLSYGVRLSESARLKFGHPYLRKRRFYGNPDELLTGSSELPQEIILLPSMSVVNGLFRNSSPWSLSVIDGEFVVCKNDAIISAVTFPIEPLYYSLKTKSGVQVNSIVTFLFGHALGIFVNTTCRFASQGNPCKFCSISANEQRPDNAMHWLSAETVSEALSIALDNDNGFVDCIFISGGNFDLDFDDNFSYYSDIAIAAKKVCSYKNRDIEVTLNVFPPKTIDLLEKLKNRAINLLISTEVFEEDNYNFYCPGKAMAYSRDALNKILRASVEILGNKRVYSFAIQGLESDTILLEGVKAYSEMGVCTIVHILHPDPNTYAHKANIPIPSPERILYVAQQVSEIYGKYDFNTSSIYGGRSSLDKESSMHIIEIRSR